MNSSVLGVRLALAYLCVVCFSSAGSQHAISLPPDSENAALLYYQAFLLRPEPNDVVDMLLEETPIEAIDHLLRTGDFLPLADMRTEISELEDQFRRIGIDYENEKVLDQYAAVVLDYFNAAEMAEFNALPGSADEKMKLGFFAISYQGLQEEQSKLQDMNLRAMLREYLDGAKPTVAVIRAGTVLDECDWGYQHSKGIAAPQPQLRASRAIASLLRARALQHAADGKVQSSLQLSLAMRKFALHLGVDTFLANAIAISTDMKSLKLIGILLRDVGTDPKQLVWLKGQLASQRPSALPLSRALQRDSEHVLQTVRKREDLLSLSRKALKLKSEIVGQTSEIDSMTDEELIRMAAKPYLQFTKRAIEIIDSNDLTFDERDSALAKLLEEFKDMREEEYRVEAVLLKPEKAMGLAFAQFASNRLLEFHLNQTRYTGFYNRLLVAIEVLLVHAQTGQWPDALPDGLPKDPFTGKGFTYEKTETGFALSFDGKYVKESKGGRYEFKSR